MVRSGIGDAPKRREDLRFLTGQGRYLDDLAFDRLTHAVVLRSPNAHAYIQSIDTGAAKTMPGGSGAADGGRCSCRRAEATPAGCRGGYANWRALYLRPRPSSWSGRATLFWGPASFCAIRVGVPGPGG
jgi:CO/xanthine dehydrogenase Mo-binding subunit